ncbi:T9SS type A sorting domain-containing protein [Nibribacter koreensis]|uniref:Ig-like domain-containing protein n=1 Tax=Nibribacter koreensis TaxID=1084519 RepID=A0ABP8F548_9BACT
MSSAVKANYVFKADKMSKSSFSILRFDQLLEYTLGTEVSVPTYALSLEKSMYDGGDFSLDFVASAPTTYDHSTGGGAYDDRTIGVDVVESLEGGDFACNDIVTFLTKVTVDGSPTDPMQSISLDYSFLADATGQSGVALGDITYVGLNTGTVSSGDGPGGTDGGMSANNNSSATLTSESLSGPLFQSGSKLLGTVQVTGLEAGETVIVRVDVRILCDPGSNPTGNLQANIIAGLVISPEDDNIQVGNQTVPFKNVGRILFPCAITGPATVCQGATSVYTDESGNDLDDVDNLWTVTGAASIIGSATGQTVQVQSTGTGNYTITLTISSEDGSAPDEVCSIPVTVNPNATLTTPDADIVCEGENAVFSSTVSGGGTGVDGADIMWYIGTSSTAIIDDDTNYDIVVSGNTSTLTIITTAELDEAIYHAKVSGTGICGSDDESASLTVHPNNSLTALTNARKCEGENASFSTTVSGGGPGVDGNDITWYKGATPIADDDDYNIVVSGNTSTLTILTVVETDEDTYHAKVSGQNICGSSDQSATLVVDPNSALTALAAVRECAGEDVSFASTVSGGGPGVDGADIIWYNGLTAIVDNNTKYDIVVSGNTSTLHILDIVEGDEGTYHAKVGGTGICGTDDESAMLTVDPNATLSALTPETECEGASASFSSTVTGGGPGVDGADIAWYKGTSIVALVDDDTKYNIVVSGNTSTLNILSLVEGDEAVYHAKIGGTDICGTDDESAMLTVEPGTSLTALTQETECAGANATFESTVSGGGAGVDGSDIAWYKGETLLTDDADYNIVVDGNKSTLTILAVEAGDAGTYHAKVGGMGICGTADQSAALIVTPNTTLTALTAVQECEGSDITFSSTVSGGGTGVDGNDISWYKGMTLLSDNTDYDIVVLGNTSTLHVLDIAEGDEGTYHAKVGGTGICGTDDESAALTVDPCSKVELQKLTDGVVDNTKDWTFTLSEGNTLLASATTLNDADGILFDGLTLSKDKTYTICETNVGAGFAVVIQYYDANGVLQEVPWFDPQTVNGGGDFNQGEAVGNYCFYIGAGTALPLPANIEEGTTLELRIRINNVPPPGGNARTPGYWKNWSSCTGGKQYINVMAARANGGDKADFWLLDDHLPHTLWTNPASGATCNQMSSFTITTCRQAFLILSETQNGGKGAKMASDAAYKLAKHLMTYQLNKKSGTYECASAASAATQAEALLAKYCFNGTASSYLSSKGKGGGTDYQLALSLAKTLDAYNNNLPCATTTVATNSVTSTSSLYAAENSLKMFPNPFSSRGNVEFIIELGGEYELVLHDMSGRVVQHLSAGTAQAGKRYNVALDGANLKEGLYLARLTSGTMTQTIRIILKR